MKPVVLAAILLGALTSPLLAVQDARTVAQPQAPPPGVRVSPPVTATPAAAPTEGPFRNVRFEIFITDSGIPKPTSKKISLMVATGREGQVRSVAQEAQGNPAFTRGVPLNVDVIRPVILANGNVMAAIVIEYQPTSPGTVAVPATVKARVDAILPNGRKTLISETADPTSDRTTTIEVIATVLP